MFVVVCVYCVCLCVYVCVFVCVCMFEGVCVSMSVSRFVQSALNS